MRQVFGKGLESLIPSKKQTNKKESPKEEPVFYIEVEKIRSNPYQPRKNFDQDGLRSLADSIKEYGILQPLLVSRVEKGSGTQYQLMAGERRFLASKMIGLTQVPVIVRDPTEKEKLEISVVENVQRSYLNSMEQAEAYKMLFQKDVAKMVGKSRESVANTLRLLELPNEIKQALRDDRITEGHARAMLALENKQKQKALFARTVKNGLNVREVESLAQKMNIWQPVKKQITGAAKEVKVLEDKIRKALGIRGVKLSMSGGKPKLTIFFDSKKEIDSLFQRMK